MLSCAARVAGLLALIACFAPAAVAAPAAPLPKIGIADQKRDMFTDPRFGELGLKQARLAVSWDALHHPWQTAQLDAWMNGARAHGIDPLITFDHSRVTSYSLPSPKRLRLEFRAFRARYPWATTFATWNETNHCGEKVCHRAGLVASYYRALRRECPTCTILAAEVIDLPSMRSWVRSFRRHLGYMPRLWGLHNYVEANRFKTTRLRQMLKLMGRTGKLWLTEVGGVVRRSNNSATDLPEGTRHAARVTRFIFDRVVKRNRQIRRVYYYHWNAGPPSTTWDSGLITYGGHERGAFWVLRRVMLRGLR
jgi:polysaccharide biosynthesis protein PslG